MKRTSCRIPMVMWGAPAGGMTAARTAAMATGAILATSSGVWAGEPRVSPPTYTAEVLPQLDTTNDPNVLTYTSPSAMSGSGVITGDLASGAGFIWSPDAGATNLRPLFSGAADAAWGMGINSSGDVCGGYQPTGEFVIRPFLLASGQSPTTLPALVGEFPCGASDLNDAGLIVGSCETAPGGMFGGPTTAVYWLGGSAFEIGGLGGTSSGAVAINAGGMVAGQATGPGGGPMQPFRWTESGGIEALPQLVSGVPASPNDINDAGIIVGRGGINFFANRAVYWDADGVIHELPSLDADPIDIGVLSINNDGVMTGFEIPTTTWEFEARLWIDGEIFRLQDLAPDLDPAIKLQRAVDINDNGTIVVEASTVVNDAVQFVTVVLTPETDSPPDLVTHVESFEDGSNVGNWTFGVPNIEVVRSQGGNPGAWLHSPCNPGPGNCLEFWYPMPTTSPLGDENVFTGNYRERGVTSVGADFITHFYWQDGSNGPGHEDFQWYLTVVLVSDNGNPGDNSDNWGAFYVGTEETPKVGEGWKSYDFAIDSQANDFPPGWQLTTGGPNAPPNPSWSDLMENVSALSFSYLDPTLPGLIVPWDVGMDNPRITYVGEKQCAIGDLDCDGVVNVFDLLELLGEWGPCGTCPAQMCPADLDENCTVNVFDLLLLLANWG